MYLTLQRELFFDAKLVLQDIRFHVENYQLHNKTPRKKKELLPSRKNLAPNGQKVRKRYTVTTCNAM